MVFPFKLQYAKKVLVSYIIVGVYSYLLHLVEEINACMGYNLRQHDNAYSDSREYGLSCQNII